MHMIDRFRKFASRVSDWLGSPLAFLLAFLLIVVWLATGPLVGFSETWQILINTVTTIATFLMVFLVQSTQNRDAKAIHLKLDELLRAVKGARNGLVDLENLSEEELNLLQAEFQRIREKYQAAAHKLTTEDASLDKNAVEDALIDAIQDETNE